MFYKLQFLIAIILLALQPGTLMNTKAQGIHYFYVATNGNDGWTGKFPVPDITGNDGPFATLTGARDAIRQLKVEGKFNQPITVMVRGGTYFLLKPFILGPEDSGSENNPITYTAFPGEKPILHGGRKITGWKRYRGKIWQSDLKNTDLFNLQFKQLIYNGKRQTLARFPNVDPEHPKNSGFLYLPSEEIAEAKKDIDSNKGVLAYEPTDWRTWQQAPTEEARGSKRILKYDPAQLDPGKWAHPKLVEISVLPYHNWTHNIIAIEDYDLTNHTILLATDASYKLIRDTRFFFQNAFEELDAPGEWYLDIESGNLYFWPPDDNLTQYQVEVPLLNGIIQLKGDAAQNSYVQFVHIGGFAIQMCKDDRDIDAVHLESARYCSIFKNTISNTGGNGLTLDDFCSDNQVVGNDMADVGRTGVIIRGRNNLISNNHIHDVGVLIKSYAISINGRMNVVSNNLIHDIPSFGITFRGFNHIMEYNVIHSFGMETTLSGGIYAYSLHDPESVAGNIIRFNKITDAMGYGMYTPGDWAAYPCFGIWLDDMISNTTVYGNILVRNVRGGVQLHGGENNLFENNIMVAGLPSTMNHIRRDNQPCNNRIIRNIFFYTNPDPRLIRRYGQIVKGITGTPNAIAPLFFVGWAVPEVAASESDYNLFCPVKGKDLHDLFFFRGAGKDITVPWEDRLDEPVADRLIWWRGQGFEEHSVMAEDPMFLDMENDDYRLQSDSPAFKIGFKPIPVERIGLFPDSNRASWPVDDR